MPKLKITVSTRKVGSRCDDVVEIDESDLEEADLNEVNEWARDAMLEMVEWNWRLEDDAGNEIQLPGEFSDV